MVVFSQILRAEFLEQVDGHLDKLLEKVALVHKTPDECVSSDNENGSNDRSVSLELSGVFLQNLFRKRKTHKVFVERESLLTYVMIINLFVE